MENEVLQNIWEELSSKNLTDSPFEAWEKNIAENEEVQANVHQYLLDNEYTSSNFDEWKANAIPVVETVKTNDSASVDPAVESVQTDTGSKLEDGSSELQNKTQEESTWLERTFGKNEVTDFFGDIYRSGSSGVTQAEALDSSLKLFSKGKDMSDAEKLDLIQKGRAIEESPQTDEMIAFNESYAEKEKEYGGVGAFFASWWENPTVMTQFTVMSLANMARSLGEGEALGVASATGAAGAGVGAGVGLIGGPLAPVTSTAGAIIGGTSAFLGGLSATMEVGATTAQLLQEAALDKGLDWDKMDNKERLKWVETVTNDKELYDDIKNKALKRGITIGAIDTITGAVTSGVGGAVSKAVAGTTRSALAGAARVGATAAVETAGGLASEIGGQLAAGQELNAQEILTEGFADKTFTAIDIARGGMKAPKYTINGETLNGKKFREAVQGMDDATIATVDLTINNDPVMNKIVENRRADIKIDEQTDPKVNDVNDRSEIIKLQRELDNLDSNKTVSGNKRKAAIKENINTILDKYEGAKADITIKQRQEAVAKARDNKLENAFNKNLKASEKLAEDLGFKEGPVVFETTDDYLKAIAKDQGVSLQEAKDKASGSEGAFLGKGKMFIDKQRAKQVGAISVASHEILHPVLNATIGDAKAQGEIVAEFKKAMTKSQLDYVTAELNKNVDPENHNTEFLNYFSDGILKNKINYDKTLFEKIGDVIIKLFKGKGFENISFDNGRDVYNFLKEYNTSIAKEGQVSKKAVEAIKSAESKSKIKSADVEVAANIQLSKTLTPEQNTNLAADVLSIKELAAENEALAKKYGKEPIKGGKQTRLEQKVLGEVMPVIEKIITNRTKALYDPIAADAKRNVTRQEFQDSMRSDIQTMLFNEYNGTQELEKFLVNRSYLRANDLAKRLGIEEKIKTSLDAVDGEGKEVTQIASDYDYNATLTEVRSEENRKKNLVDPRKILGPQRSKEYTDAVKDAISEMVTEDFDVLSFAKIKDLAPAVTAEWWRTTMKKVITPSANLASSEIPHIQRLILKNADTFISLLPEGAILKGETAREDLIGTGVGVPRKLQQVFYDKGERTSKRAGIIPFNLKKNITKGDFLTAFGINEDGTFAKFGGKDPRAQTMLALIRLYGQITTNTAVRELADLTGAQNADIRAGAAKIQFSKAALERPLTVTNKKRIKIRLEELSIDLKNDNPKKPILKGILSKLDDVDNYGEFLQLIFKSKEISDILNANEIGTYRAELLGKIINSFESTEISKFISTALEEFDKVYKYQWQVIGFSYVESNLQSVLNDSKLSEKEKGDYLENFLFFTSRDIRTKGINGLTTNEKLFKYFIKKNRLGFKLLKEKSRSYITRDGKKLTGLTEILEIKNNPVENVAKVAKEALEARSYLISIIDKAKENNEVAGAIGQLTLNYVDQRGPVRKLSIPGFVEKNIKGKRILEHETEAYYIYKKLIAYAKSKITIKELNEFLDNSTFNIVSEKFDNLLKKIEKEYGFVGKERYTHELAKEYLSRKGIIQLSKTLNKATINLAPNGKPSLLDETLYNVVRTPEFKEWFGDWQDVNKRSSKVLDENGEPLIVYHGTDRAIKEFDSSMPKQNMRAGEINGFWFTNNKKNSNLFTSKKYQDKESAPTIVSAFIKLQAPLIVDFNDKKQIEDLVKNQYPDPAVWAYRKKQFNEINWNVKRSLLDKAIDKAREKRFYDGVIYKNFKDKILSDNYLVFKGSENIKIISNEQESGKKTSKTTTQFSKTLNKDFNNIIEDATGIESFKKFSEAKGKVRGQNKGRFKFFIPPSADDFAGLLYKLTGKGKKGEVAQAWFKENLFDPFSRGINEFEQYKQRTTTIMRAIKKEIKNVPQGLKKVNETGFKNEDAVRVYLWAKNGIDIPGLSETDKKELVNIISNNDKLKDFSSQIADLVGGYPDPQNDWLAGTITTDIINMINTSKRQEFLTEWQANADEIFSKENINKLRAAFGDNYIDALQDMLYRMKSGRARPSGSNKLTNNFLTWVNDSVGTIMFFNTRSAVLQTLSMTNFLNWSDNNPVMAAKAFANQKQFWSDFAMLFNSDFLKQRRSGLKNDVNADDIANAAASSTNKVRAAAATLLKAGFLPTQMADSFAIAMGGASFVRNRINKYVKEGMSKTEAEQQAFLDFQEVTEESQQSSRPDRVSQQQASPLGRIVLAFANTPMQYMRLTKKAVLDIKNGRGDLKTNISKIVYYTAVQNIIFSSLQAAMFASMFEDDDEEAIDKKELKIANSMLDTMLRGVGVYGAIVATGKNIFLEAKVQAEKDRPNFTNAAMKALDISPPISSKMRKLMSGARAFSYRSVREKMTGYGLDNPAYLAVGEFASAATNIPLDRMVRKADNLRVAMDNETKLWQSIALGLGYSQWDLGLVKPTKSKSSKGKKRKGKGKYGNTIKWGR